MEKRDLRFKNFISIFFKNLTFGKITEDDINNNEINFYKESDTETYKGGKYNISDDILKLKLEIPNTVATQFNDLETKFNKIVKRSNNLIPEIQKQLEEKKNNYLSYGGVDEPNDNLSDNLSYSPQQFNNTESFDSQINNDSIIQQQTDSDLELDDSDDFDLSNSNISDSKLKSLEESKKSINDSFDNEEYRDIEYSEDKKESVDNEIIDNDYIEKQLIDLYEPLKDKLKNDTKTDLELDKKIVLLSNDLDPYENLLKDYKKSEQKESSKDDKPLFGGIEKINLVDDNNFNEDEDIINDDKIESESDNEINDSKYDKENVGIDNDNDYVGSDNDNKTMDIEDNNVIEIEKDNDNENMDTENDNDTDDEDLMQSSISIDPDYAKEIITNVIEDQQNENRKIRFGF